MNKYFLNVACPSTCGIVAAISGYLTANGCNITDSTQFDDVETGNFFMRVSITSEEGVNMQTLTKGYAPIAK